MPAGKRLRGRPRAFYDKGAQNRVKSLERALDVLDCLSEGGGLSLSEIAERLDQSPATIYRILSTFEHRQIVEMDPARQEWFIGVESFRLGSAYLRRTSVIERARPVMRELMTATGETANLGVEVSGEVMFVSQVETHETIRAFFPPGTKSPMHASGIGKALLAHAGDARIADYLKQGKLRAFTAKTLSDPDALLGELEQIRARGFALDDEEKSTGMRCVAAPVFNEFGEAIAGISISGPTTRLPFEKIESVGKMVMEKAALLSR